MNNHFNAEIQHHIDVKTKPQGALGMLERLALQLASMQSQQSLTKKICFPQVMLLRISLGVFASRSTTRTRKTYVLRVMYWITGYTVFICCYVTYMQLHWYSIRQCACNNTFILTLVHCSTKPRRIY